MPRALPGPYKNGNFTIHGAPCCLLPQGYGLTETCACNFVAFPNLPGQEGTVGPPTGCLEARLEAVPEMGYDPMANPPRGELCVRGDCVFKGYYKVRTVQ